MTDPSPSEAHERIAAAMARPSLFDSFLRRAPLAADQSDRGRAVSAVVLRADGAAVRGIEDEVWRWPPRAGIR